MGNGLEHGALLGLHELDVGFCSIRVLQYRERIVFVVFTAQQIQQGYRLLECLGAAVVTIGKCDFIQCFQKPGADRKRFAVNNEVGIHAVESRTPVGFRLHSHVIENMYNRGMPSPIVFVDFDGVLHPESPCYAHRLFERADALGEVLRDHQAWAVLSTSWRLNHDMRQLQRQMGTQLGERVVGVNPQIDDLDRRALPDKLQGFPRHMECVAYLRAQDAHLDHWVALDDRPYWFYPFCPQLLVCNPKTGLTDENLKDLSERLALMR